MSWAKIAGYVLEGFDRFTNWMKKRKRLGNVKKMDDAVDSCDCDTVARKLKWLRKEAKSRNDSR